MNYSEIMYDVADNIATITFNRPDRLNAWTYTMGGEYQHALADAEAREEVRVIILTGAGRGFCAGLDMDQLTDIAEGTAPGSGFERVTSGAEISASMLAAAVIGFSSGSMRGSVTSFPEVSCARM
ncbi:MAG: enoyl-CoA hydratase/isomerase family protein [Candidatus Hydrogenedentes bacterium]|nr:enoyl-CoA hydratase/isomerase family protein [Candidatus Hydrogenedentota bacterium]